MQKSLTLKKLQINTRHGAKQGFQGRVAFELGPDELKDSEVKE